MLWQQSMAIIVLEKKRDNMKEKGMSKGELQSVCQAVGYVPDIMENREIKSI